MNIRSINIRKLIIAIALVVSMPAAAQLVTLVNAIETSPANIILPASTSGMVTFRPCADECDEDYKRVKLSSRTTFSVNGKTVKFDEFRRNFATIKRAETSYALVSYDTDTNTVISIQLAG